MSSARSLNAAEEEGLVGSTVTQNPTHAFGFSRCLCVVLFVMISLLMLLVGFFAGKDSSANALRKHLDNMYNNAPPPSPHNLPGEQLITTSPSTQTFTAAPTLEPKPKHKFDKAALKQARTQAQNRIDYLEKYYGKYAEKVLLGDVGFGFGFTGKNKAPTNPVSFARNVKLIARALVHQESLKLGFIGSSVMCGHDNCYYDSFPAQLDRLIKPIFKAAGSDVVMRNACQGGGCGDNYANQIFCFRHMVGDDIDFLFYEWTYFETGGFEWMFHDTIARWTAMLAKGPATMIFHCDQDAWGKKQIEEKWAVYGSNSMNMEAGLRAGGAYKGKVWGEVGDGMHDTTRYGEDTGTTAARKKSLGVVFRNWHPGPLGLQYIADLTAYLLLRATVQAVDEILQSPNPEKQWELEPMDNPPLPEVSFTKKDNALLYEVATRLEEEPPGCLTAQSSTFGRAIVSVSDKTDDYLNPYRDHVIKVNSESPQAWRLWEAKLNWDMVPREERSMGDMCQPPDRCGYFHPPESLAKTPIVFRLPKMVVGLITLCGNNGEFGKKLMEKKSTFVAEFDGKILDPNNYVVFPNQKCLTIQPKFTGPVDNKNGHLYLALTTTDANFKISQVITA